MVVNWTSLLVPRLDRICKGDFSWNTSGRLREVHLPLLPEGWNRRWGDPGPSPPSTAYTQRKLWADRKSFARITHIIPCSTSVSLTNCIPSGRSRPRRGSFGPEMVSAVLMLKIGPFLLFRRPGSFSKAKSSREELWEGCPQRVSLFAFPKRPFPQAPCSPSCPGSKARLDLGKKIKRPFLQHKAGLSSVVYERSLPLCACTKKNPNNDPQGAAFAPGDPPVDVATFLDQVQSQASPQGVLARDTGGP